MSPLQKQILARKAKASNRVVNKKKKILAMMEEETVIDDPNAKAARLISYKKIEVWLLLWYQFSVMFCIVHIEASIPVLLVAQKKISA